MFKNLKTFLLSSVTSLVTLIAINGVSTKSMWLIYEPDIPKSLKKEL